MLSALQPLATTWSLWPRLYGRTIKQCCSPSVRPCLFIHVPSSTTVQFRAMVTTDHNRKPSVLSRTHWSEWPFIRVYTQMEYAILFLFSSLAQHHQYLFSGPRTLTWPNWLGLHTEKHLGLQKHSLDGCAIDMPPSNCHRRGRAYCFAARYLVLAV